MISIIAVLDIGKTNVKLCALALESGEQLETLRRTNEVLPGKPYPHADVDGIWEWYCAGLKRLATRYEIRYLTCTTHGATAACLANGELVLPVLDYEADCCEQTDVQYDRVRPGYSETLSPALGCGLNLGRQLYWLSLTRPGVFSQVDTILMYPQYWGWRLSGVAVSEVTSLGCHTDLWRPREGVWSSLVETLNWQGRFPLLLAAGEILGPVLPELAQALGLPSDCRVVNGIHDSNASLVPYLRRSKPPFTVISTGTWTVMAAVGAGLGEMAERDDMLANVSAYGDPVPCIRFMGGREWELLREEDDCDLDDLQAVLEQGVYALPSFTVHGGPFRRCKGRIQGQVDELDGRQRTALASLYCALVTDYCLGRIRSAGPIHIEGSFARNPVYLHALQTLRPGQRVLASHDATGTTQGAAQMIEGCDWVDRESAMEVPSGAEVQGLVEYRRRWLGLLESEAVPENHLRTPLQLLRHQRT